MKLGLYGHRRGPKLSLPKQHFPLLNIRNRLPKTPVGPFGTKPGMASTFIGILTLMDPEALAGFAMPARASAFSSKNYKNVLNADALTGIAKPTRASSSISVSILMNAEAMSSFVPKEPTGLLAACC